MEDAKPVSIPHGKAKDVQLPNKLAITVEGTRQSGRSFLKYQLVFMLVIYSLSASVAHLICFPLIPSFIEVASCLQSEFQHDRTTVELTLQATRLATNLHVHTSQCRRFDSN